MKTKTLLIAAVMFLGLTAAAFAQATYSVGSIPVTAVINTGLTENSGDITFTQISGTSVTGTITISYGVPVTVDLATVVVSAPAATGYGTATAIPGDGFVSSVTVNVAASNNAAGVLVLNVPGGIGAGSFSLSGVRVAVAGTTLTSLSASISTTNNAIVAGQTNVIVISSIAAGIASIKSNKAAVINSVTGVVNPSANIEVKEGFLNAWGDPLIKTNAGIRITLSAAPPSGVTITFPATATTNGAGTPVFTTIKSDGTALGTTVEFTSTSTTLVVYYRATSTTDATKQETLSIPVAIDTADADLPIPATTITYVVSLAPIGTAFDDGDVITDANLIPRYAALDVGPATLLSTTASVTSLLVPFAQTATAAGYNTGFAIANTTADPGEAAGITSPVTQSGTITFYFFPQLPSPTGTQPAMFSYTTGASSPGTGLNASGKLPAGSTYTVLLSQILADAGAPADFAGYVFIVTNFTNAHCLYVVSNFTTFSQGSLALVVELTEDGIRISPEGLNN
jgi:hypothetical protein